MRKISHFRVTDVVFKTEELKHPEAKEEYYLRNGDILLAYRTQSGRLLFEKDIPISARLDLTDVLDCLGIVHC